MFFEIGKFQGLNPYFPNPDVTAQPAFTCSKLTIETLEQDVKYV